MVYIKKYWTLIFIIFAILVFVKPVLCILLLGMLGLYICIETFFILKKIQTDGIECYGKIVGYNTDGDGGRIPIVEFITKQGELIKEEPLAHGSINLLEVFSFGKEINKPVLIKYNPESPKHFVFVNGNNEFVIFIGVLICLIFIAVSICGLLGYINME
jgi:hypothetical protein